VSSIRSFRILRPLRTITRVRGIRVIVISLLDSVPMIANVMLLFAFMLFFFGVIGVQLFMGRLRYRCFEDALATEPLERVCGCDVDFSDFASAPLLCPAALTLPGRCAAGQVCMQAAQNPEYGIKSFDNLAAAVYNVFEALTLEGWTNDTYRLQAGSNSPLAYVNMCAVVLVLAFFVVNLFLAVIFLSFENTRKVLAKEETQDDNADADAELAREQMHAERARWPVQRQVYALITSPHFTAFFTLVIVVNTALMACEYHRMPAELAVGLRYANYGLTALFALELVLVFVGRGPSEWLEDSFNLFDTLVVSISLLEIVLDSALGFSLPGLSVLRAFRLLRVFKLARSWSGLQMVLATVVSSLSDISYLAGLLLLIKFIFALLGMQLFGTIYGDPADAANLAATPQANFNDLGYALVTIFTVISGENWDATFHSTVGGMQAGGQPAAYGYLYFVSLMLVGNFVLMNLFVAILLSNFESIGELMRTREAASSQKLLARIALPMQSIRSLETSLTCGLSLRSADSRARSRTDRLPAKAADARALRAALAATPAATPATDAKSRWHAAMAQTRERRASSLESDAQASTSQGAGAPAAPATPVESRTAAELAALEVLRRWRAGGRSPAAAGQAASPERLPAGGSGAFEAPACEEAPTGKGGCCAMLNCFEASARPTGAPGERTLFLFAPDNRVRLRAAAVIQHRLFEPLMLVLILVSSAFLIVDSPFLTDPALVRALRGFDICFSVVFGLEMVSKWVTDGLYFTKTGSFKDPFSVLDALVVLVTVTALLLPAAHPAASQITSIRALRAIRTLRPLRLIASNPGMRHVIDVLYKALPAIRNASLIFLLFLLIFGILGVQLFAGRLGACSDPAVYARADCVGLFRRAADAALVPREWANAHTGHFDNIGASCLVLFEMTTFEMWPDVMYSTVDSSPDLVDVGPVRDANRSAVVFSIMWILVGTLFMLNLFVGVVIDEFNRVKTVEHGSALLTPQQREWVEMNNMMTTLRVPELTLKPTQGVRLLLFTLVESMAFKGTIIAMILLNALAIAITHLGQPAAMTEALYFANYIFSAVFIAEAALKLAAYGPPVYFRDGWNVFDFGLVLVAFVDIALDQAGVNGGFNPTVLRIFRLARLLRLLRLVRRGERASEGGSEAAVRSERTTRLAAAAQRALQGGQKPGAPALRFGPRHTARGSPALRLPVPVPVRHPIHATPASPPPGPFPQPNHPTPPSPPPPPLRPIAPPDAQADQALPHALPLGARAAQHRDAAAAADDCVCPFCRPALCRRARHHPADPGGPCGGL
jgi:hypothetical protein